MEDVISRIIEVERQCAEALEQAERDCILNIEAHRRTLEERKAREFALIAEANSARLSQALEDAGRRIREASSALAGDEEALFQEPALIEAIKEKIVSILLED